MSRSNSARRRSRGGALITTLRHETLVVEGVEVVVERKRIKTLRLRVCPPDGEVRLSAPMRASRAEIVAAVGDRLGWIESHRHRFASTVATSSLEYVSGEVHYHRGQAVTLRVEARQGRPKVSLEGDGVLLLRCPPHLRLAERAAAIDSWQRLEARREAELLVATWAPRLGVEVSAIGLKRMSTRWGTCNPQARRVWLNTELIKRPPHCFEYVVVHELAHVLVPDHSKAFWAVVAAHLPGWRASRAELERWPTWAHGRAS